jgi:hypothetical protein
MELEMETSPIHMNISPRLQAKKAARDEKRKQLEAMMKKTRMQVVAGESATTPTTREGKSSISTTSSGESSSESAPATTATLPQVQPRVQPQPAPLVQYSSYQHPAEEDDIEDLERGGCGPGHVVVIDTNSKHQYHNKGQLLREQAQSLIHNVMEQDETEGVVVDDSYARKKKAMSAALAIGLLYWWL